MLPRLQPEEALQPLVVFVSSNLRNDFVLSMNANGVGGSDGLLFCTLTNEIFAMLFLLGCALLDSDMLSNRMY